MVGKFEPVKNTAESVYFRRRQELANGQTLLY